MVSPKPKSLNPLNNIQTLETEICSRFSDLEKKLMNINNTLLEKVHIMEKTSTKNKEENEVISNALQSKNRDLEI